MVTRRMRGNAIAGLLATMILGCSNSNEGAGDGPIPPAGLVEAVVHASCGDLADCCAQDGFPFSERGCRNQAETVMNDRFERGTLVYDAEAGGRCARALRDRPSQCGGADEDFAACEGVFRGNVPIGEPCVEGLDCAGFPDDAVCPFGDGTVCTPGAQRPKRAARGESCSGTCRVDGEQQVCGGLGPEPLVLCFTDDGLYCAGATHICEPLVAEGGTCERQPDFAGCAAGMFCEHERCVPVRGAGESCLADICVAPLTCPARSELACGPGLTCPFGDDPRCTAPQPDGSACTSFLECASRNCDTSSCTEQSCTGVGVCSPFKRTTRESCQGLLELDEAAASSALFAGAR